MRRLERTAGETAAERIKKIWQALPPRPGVNTRQGHADVDYFAELLGTRRQRVIDWTKHGKEPQPKFRARLAELSEGVYRPDDFRTRASYEEILRRVEALERDLKARRDGKEPPSAQPQRPRAPRPP